jgi:hypothetical protein
MKEIDTAVSRAISHRLGRIDALPQSAQKKIREVYREFCSAYMGIGGLKGKKTEQWDGTDLDPEVIEYMRHFFSDYQKVCRDFLAVNCHAQALARIDRKKQPESLAARLDALLSLEEERADDRILEALSKI